MLTIVIAGALCTSCGRQPAEYPVPAQRSLNLGQEPGGLGAFVTMDDAAADDYIVRDIAPNRDHHRWAFAHPELRFRIKESGFATFTAEFALPEATFKATGPVSVSAAVAGKTLGSIRCDHAGDYRIELPVPPGILAPGKEVHVTLEAAPRWVSPADGAELSFYLKSAGFTR
jgi:hypothetical protein